MPSMIFIATVNISTRLIAWAPWPDPCPVFAGPIIPGILIPQVNLTRVFLQLTRENFHKGRFACPVLPQKRMDFPHIHFKAQIVQSSHAGEVLAYPNRLDNRISHFVSFFRFLWRRGWGFAGHIVDEPFPRLDDFLPGLFLVAIKFVPGLIRVPTFTVDTCSKPRLAITSVGPS